MKYSAIVKNKRAANDPLLKAIQKEQAVTIDENLARYNPYDIPEDFVEFASMCRIRSKGGIVPFKLFDYQIELAKVLNSHRGTVVYKSRQLGLTESVSCVMLHQAALNPAYAGAVLSMNQDKSSKVALRTRRMPSAIPGFQFNTDSKTELRIKDGGTLMFLPSTDNAVRSLESMSTLFFDEAAFVDNIEEIYSSAIPSQEMAGDDAKVIVASTMSEQGKLSWFWQMFDSNNPVDAIEMIEKVKAGKEEPFTYWVDSSGWAKVIIHWLAHPIYSLVPDYLQRTKDKNKLTDEKLQREYNLGIPAAGGSLFNMEALDRCAIGEWKLPQKGRYYMACIDPNFGGSDRFVTQIWDITEPPYALVAEYAEKERSTNYSRQESLLLIDAYNVVLCAIESNSGGKVIAENIVSARPDLRVEVTITTNTSKRVNTDRIALATEQGEVIYPADWKGKDEAKRFGVVSREAPTGFHDDRLMAWAAGWAWIDEAVADIGKDEYIPGVGQIKRINTTPGRR